MSTLKDEPGIGAALAALALMILTFALYLTAMYFTLISWDWKRALVATSLFVVGLVAVMLFGKAWGLGEEKRR